MSISKRCQSKHEVKNLDSLSQRSKVTTGIQAISEQKKKYNLQENSYRLKDKPSEQNIFNCPDNR